MIFFSNKQEARQQGFLPVFEPHNMSAAAIPQMASREGWEGQLFNPLQHKHDLFEWWGISQDILVWEDLPKQLWATHGSVFAFQKQIFKIWEQQIGLNSSKKQRLSVVKCKVVNVT